MTQLFADRLRMQAAKNSGHLTARDIQAVLQGYAVETDPNFRKHCEATWTDLQTLFEDSFFERMRKFPLERMIVHKFVHLLPNRGDDPVPGKTLSRRVIPAFSQALHQMVGPELFDQYEERARTLIESKRAKEGSAVDWETLYSLHSAQVLVNDILIYISRYFTDVHKRREWMISFFDRTMPHPKSDAERDWHFSDMEFHKLMSALYRDLAETLFDVEGRQKLEQRYDAVSLAQLESMLAGLAQDQKRVLAS